MSFLCWMFPNHAIDSFILVFGGLMPTFQQRTSITQSFKGWMNVISNNLWNGMVMLVVDAPFARSSLEATPGICTRRTKIEVKILVCGLCMVSNSDDCFFHRFNVMRIFPDCSAIMHLESSCSTNALFIFQGCFTHCLFQRVKAWAKALLHIEAFQLGLLHGLHPQSVFFFV